MLCLINLKLYTYFSCICFVSEVYLALLEGLSSEETSGADTVVSVASAVPEASPNGERENQPNGGDAQEEAAEVSPC